MRSLARYLSERKYRVETRGIRLGRGRPRASGRRPGRGQRYLDAAHERGRAAAKDPRARARPAGGAGHRLARDRKCDRSRRVRRLQVHRQAGGAGDPAPDRGPGRALLSPGPRQARGTGIARHRGRRRFRSRGARGLLRARSVLDLDGVPADPACLRHEHLRLRSAVALHRARPAGSERACSTPPSVWGSLGGSGASSASRQQRRCCATTLPVFCSSISTRSTSSIRTWARPSRR